MSELDSVLKDIQKKYGQKVVTIGTEGLLTEGVLSLGSPSFDVCLYGGMPEGRIIELSGAEGSGKTTCAFLMAASYQRKELKRNPKNPRAIIFLDNEGTGDPLWAKKLGYDMSADATVKTITIRPEAQSAEQIFDMAINLLKTGEVGLMIFDSIATLVPSQIFEASMENKQMGGISASLTRFANTIVGLLRKYKATLIGINQLRENLTQYGDRELTPGGRAWRHQCSVRLKFKRGEFYDAEGNKLKTTAESPAGHIIEVAVLKTKVCPWDRKLGSLHLNYVYGADIIEDTIDVAIKFKLIDNSTQGWFTILNPDTGEIMMNEKDKPCKIQGRKNLKAFFEEHKDIWKKLYSVIYEKIAQRKEDYSKIFCEMLDADIEKAFGVDLTKESQDE